MNEPTVLIVAGLYDFSVDLVALRLRELDVPFFRLNREQLADFRITLDPREPTLLIQSSNSAWEFGPGLRSVFFRQPVFLRNTPPLPLTPHDQLGRSQWGAFLRGLAVFAGASWMNSPSCTYLAESKPFQLLKASRCGFSIPDTLVSNDAESIKRAFSGGMIVKSMDTVLLHEGGDSLFTYTSVASPVELTDENSRSAPMIAQRELAEKVDLRVTVVGEAIFAVRIVANGRGIEGDWRRIPREALRYEDIQLSSNIAQMCRDLTQELGLAFAAIDLLETPDGIFFLEVNPTGEWGC